MSRPRNALTKARRHAFKLALVAPVMFAFAVVLMPPLYALACDLLGIGGEAERARRAQAAVDDSRRVQVEFVANRNAGSPLAFRAPAQQVRTVHPGEWIQVRYRAHNPLREPVTAQATHRIIPAEYARYVNLVECFCYDQQSYAGGEQKALPVAFTVSPELPARIEHLTFSYTFYRVEGS